jgi:hypothetical protein
MQTLPIIFRSERAHGTLWITAVFPTLPGTNDPATFQIYQHIGQHGAGSRAWYLTTRPATPTEYAPLLAELRAIYEEPRGGTGTVVLRVIKRFSPRSKVTR